MMALFLDRADAGRKLSDALGAYAGRDDLVVLALPRGGVPVAFEVARALGAPLDVLLVRKLGAPRQRELAMGAIASGGVRVVNEEVVRAFGISQAVLDAAEAEERVELERRERLYRGDRAPLEVRDRVAIVVDDGLATGATMRAAVRALRQRDPARIVVAVPSASADACAALRPEVDDLVCVATPEPYVAVGIWYGDFRQTEDAEVRALLARAPAPAPEAPRRG